MKDINLPITNTFSITLSFNTAKRVVGEDGEVELVSKGSIVNSEKQQEIETARLNGGKILYATTSIEKKIEGILTDYFMGPFQGPDDRRVLFENDVIQSSSFPYNFKKELIKKITHQHKLLEGKLKNKLEKYLKDIMNWRNAFAHGKIKHDDKKGCLIEYYSNGIQALFLTDEYWNEVESTFIECDGLLMQLDREIDILYKQ